jgi:(1->4)-alpha-D-glucan 1-alpha-D-glucosylmutase
VVPRLVARLAADWAGTTVTLPSGSWTDVIIGEVTSGTVGVAELLARFPVAVLGQVR